MKYTFYYDICPVVSEILPHKHTYLFKDSSIILLLGIKYSYTNQCNCKYIKKSYNF